MEEQPQNNDTPDQPQTFSPSSKKPRSNPLKPIATTVKQRVAARQQQIRPQKKKLAGLVVMVLVAAAAGFAGGELSHQDDALSGGSLSQQKKVVSSEGQLINQISKQVGPSVVSISTNTTTQTEGYFGFGGQSQNQSAAGTGMIISKDGYILTNRHVVPAGTTSITVTLTDGTSYDNVSVVGRTSANDSLDVAVLKIKDLKGKQLSSVVFGNSGQASVGDAVVAIGNALGEFQNTVTSGIISGFGRSVTAGGGSYDASTEDLVNLIQTDAAINEGNSGGPLVNLNGQVIGINTAIASDAQNIGFAIPIDDVKGLIGQVLKTGKFQRPFLGVRYVQLTKELAEQYGIKQTSGAYIIPRAISGQPGVVSGSPAANAGLQAGDVITKIDTTRLTTNYGLSTALNKYQPGDKVSLTVVRDGKTMTISAKLGTSSAAN